MSADQLAEIRPCVREVLAVSAGDARAALCATLEISGRPQAWVQITRTTLNFAWLDARSPLDLLPDILESLPNWQLESWEAHKYATVTFASGDIRAIAISIDALFERLFAGGDYAVDASMQRLS